MRTVECGVRNRQNPRRGGAPLHSASRTPHSALNLAGCLGIAPSSRRLRAGTSLSKFATRKPFAGGKFFQSIAGAVDKPILHFSIWDYLNQELLCRQRTRLKRLMRDWPSRLQIFFVKRSVIIPAS